MYTEKKRAKDKRKYKKVILLLLRMFQSAQSAWPQVVPPVPDAV